jgi:hypothetical protein
MSVVAHQRSFDTDLTSDSNTTKITKTHQWISVCRRRFREAEPKESVEAKLGRSCDLTDAFARTFAAPVVKMINPLLPGRPGSVKRLSQLETAASGSG